MPRFFQTVFLTLGLLSILSCNAEEKIEQKQYVAGTHYEVLDTPVRTSNPDKIEVAEFFWYGCPHCYHFEPSINAWLKNIPSDVHFEQVPAMWHPAMELHAKMFYSAKQLNALDALHEVFFTAMQVGKLRLASEQEIAPLFIERGIDKDAFSKAFNSFGVDSLVKQAKAKASGAQITGTPELVVNGKYRVSAQLAGSQPEMLKVVDFLIEKSRQEK